MSHVISDPGDRTFHLSEFHSSGILVPQNQNTASKVLLQDIKHFIGSMMSSSVLHETRLFEIRVTFYNRDEIIFKNIGVSFSSHRTINEYRTDYSISRHCTLHSHSLRDRDFSITKWGLSWFQMSLFCMLKHAVQWHFHFRSANYSKLRTHAHNNSLVCCGQPRSFNFITKTV